MTLKMIQNQTEITTELLQQHEINVNPVRKKSNGPPYQDKIVFVLTELRFDGAFCGMNE